MTTKKDIAIINRLERENKKSPQFVYSHGIQIDNPIGINKIGYEVYFNGYEAMCMNDGTIEGIPFDYEGDKPIFPVERYFNHFTNHMYNPEEYFEIEIDRASVEAAKKNCSRSHCDNPWVYKLYDGRKIGFNPRFLLDHMDFCKTNKVKIWLGGFSDKDGVYRNPAYFVNADMSRISLLLPVYVKNDSYKEKHESEAA